MKRILFGAVLFVAIVGLVQLVQPGGPVFAGSDNEGAQGIVSMVSTTGPIRNMPDGINMPLANLGDYVWHDQYHDANHLVDGIQDAGEPPLEGVVIELYNTDGMVVAMTITDMNGYYHFDGVEPGDYKVKVADSNFEPGGVLEGWYASPPNQGNDEALDSDGDRDTHEVWVSLNPGETNNDVDFAFFKTGIDLEKTGPATVNQGDDIVYHFRVENTGDVVLHGGAHVYDALIEPSGDHEIWSDVVYPGEVKEFDRTYTPDGDDCGCLTNTATAVGHPQYPDGSYLDDVTDEDSWTTEIQCGSGASLGDFVWLDLNGDGVQDADEPGMAGVTVHLLDANGTVLATDTSDAEGHYQFTQLDAGDYMVEFVLPDGYTFSPRDNAGDDTLDSDADTSTGRTAMVTLSEGDSNQTLDAGLIYRRATENVCYAVSDSDDELVSVNADGTGFQDIGDLGVLNVEAIAFDLGWHTLYGADEGVLGTIDINTGEFSAIGSFGGGNGAEGWVDFDDVDSLSFDPVTGVFYGVARRDGSNDVLFQIDPTTGSRVPDAFGPGVDYVVVNSGDVVGLCDIDDIAVDPAGQMYGIANSCGNDHLIKIDKFTGEVTDVGPFTVNGTALDNMEGLTSYGTEALYGTTGASSNDPESMWRIDKATGAATKITTFPQFTDYEAIDCMNMPLPSLGDYVWHDLYHDQNHLVDGIQDAGEPPLEGVVIELYDASGRLIATDTTDADGYYHFDNLDPGDYRVKVADSNFEPGGVLEGWYASPPNQGNDEALDSDGDRDTHEAWVTLCLGDINNDVDFAFFKTGIDLEKTGPATVNQGDEIVYHFRVENTGDVVLHGGAHVYDALIEPSGDHEIWSDVVYPGEVKEFDRTYTPDGDDCGSLTNTATAVGHPQYPDGSYLDDVTDEDSWTTQVNCPSASLGDLVWHDLNANGQQDAGEPGIEGALVSLYRDADGDGIAEPDGDDGEAIAFTSTDSNGKYLFDGLSAGDYFLKFTKPAGYDKASPTTASSASDPNDSDAHVTTGVTDIISLEAGESDMTWDAGFFKYASVGDRVWWDLDQDGIQDPDESSLTYVTVTLEDADGNIIQIGGTGDDGYYLFDALTPGDYIIYFGTPGNGWSMSPQNQGDDDALDSDPDPVTWEVPVTLTSGEHNDTIDAGEYTDTSYTITKENTTVETEIAPGDPVSFTITIENTGNTVLTAIPLRDTYDNNYLTFVGASVAPDDTIDDGQIDWSDLTVSFGRDLDPGERFSLVVDFTAKAPTDDLADYVTTNTATAHDVLADPDGADGPTCAAVLPDQSDEATLGILDPVGETMSGFSAMVVGHVVHLQWQTASEADILGFNVLRRLEGGQFQQINDGLIFAQHPGADMGDSYRFRDQVPSGEEAVYVLEVIHLNGHIERYGWITIQMVDIP